MDLDVLRPEPVIVRLGGNDIDVSFIPCAITFELEEIVQEMSKLTEADVRGQPEVARRGFDMAIELCALFCRRDHAEMTKDWFLAQTDAGQVGAFADAIKDALVQSYEGAGRYQRNPPKAKGTKKATA